MKHFPKLKLEQSVKIWLENSGTFEMFFLSDLQILNFKANQMLRCSWKFAFRFFNIWVGCATTSYHTQEHIPTTHLHQLSPESF